MADTKQDILIVDDDLSVRLSISYLLAQGGGTARLAEDGLAALARIREHVPQILLSDLNMPRMSGFELLSVVRCRFPQIKVIAMSGGFSGTGIPPGVVADAFYEKGSNPRLLLNTVNAMQHSDSLAPINSPHPLASVWVPGNSKTFSGELNAIISCPECLRTFSHTIDEATADICETTCVYCEVPICYVSAPTVLPGLTPVFPRIPVLAIPSSLSVPDYR